MTLEEAILKVYGLGIEEGKDERNVESFVKEIYDDFDNIISELLNKYSTIAEIVINKEEEDD